MPPACVNCFRRMDYVDYQRLTEATVVTVEIAAGMINPFNSGCIINKSQFSGARKRKIISYCIRDSVAVRALADIAALPADGGLHLGHRVGRGRQKPCIPGRE